MQTSLFDIQDTSIASYKELKDKIGERQQEYINFLLKYILHNVNYKLFM